MNISIQPFTEDRIASVQAFNARLLAGGLEKELAFPETPDLDFPVRGAPIWQEPFLALDPEGETHGGYYFTHERWAVRGDVRWIANYRHPISEVVVNKAYRGLGSVLLGDARRRQPLLYSVGFGGEKNPNLKRLRAEGWSGVPIPFWFHVACPSAFFRNLAFFRKTPVRRALFDLAAFTGSGWLAIKAAQALRTSGHALEGCSVETAPCFGPWADKIWDANRSAYLLAAVRDRETLNLRYPPENRRFTRVTISHGDQVAGWAVLIDKPMQGNPYFGDMRVGTIVDCLALPGSEAAVVAAARDRLNAAGVDLVVSNQSSSDWGRAFRQSGFFSGPSNYHLALSAELTSMLAPLDANASRFHINRGDGAGISRL